MSECIYYTYAYFCEERSVIYYVGKGKGDRAFKKRKSTKIPVPKDPKNILFIKENVSEEEAFACEILMIKLWGRKDLGTGTLWNRTDGGEGQSGRPSSEKQKKATSESNRKRDYTEIGRKVSLAKTGVKRKPFSEEHLANMRGPRGPRKKNA